MKKKYLFIIIPVLICTLLAGGVVIYLNSNCYYAKKLVSAIRDQNIAAVQEILQKKPTCINTYPSIIPRRWYFTRATFPLIEACITGNLELVTILLENGADPNCNDGYTPLSVTYTNKKRYWYAMSRTLLEHGASLNYITIYSGGKFSVLQDIVRVRAGGALPGYEPENGDEVNSAFFYALENCDHQMVDWVWVMHNSVSSDRIEIVKFLLDQGYCNVNDVSTTGMSFLMFAARDSTLEMAQLLLDYGVDISVKDDDGKTAYDYAIESGHMEIAEMVKP